MTGVLDRPAPPPDLTLPYGPRPEHVVDLRLPAQAGERKTPLIVLVHGGFWRPAYDRTHLGPMAHALAAAGYLVAVPEYRRAGMAEEGWTGTFDDIAMAVDQVTAIAAAHGADTGTITWAGHSAGGHLVLWAAARPGLPSWPCSRALSPIGPASPGKARRRVRRPAFTRAAPGNNDPGPGVPCPSMALRSQKGTAPWECRGTEVTGKQTCGEAPPD